jgi:predicted XRE-type DNA-binding protein
MNVAMNFEAMESVSGAIAERTRKNVTAILKQMAEVGQSRLAACLDVHESTVSKMKDTQIEQIGKMLAVLGLTVVKADKEFFSVKEIDALLTLAKMSLDGVDSAADLVRSGT